MAAPITHILFAFQLDKDCSQNFILGTSFPDIRYLGVIRRDVTHTYTLKNLVDTESFTEGMAFHQYIDQHREQYWQKLKVYDRLPQSTHTPQALKFLEDIVLYDRLESWDSIVRWFEYIPAEERTFGISDNELKRWHRLLAKYITSKPSLENIYELTHSLDTSGKITSELQELLPVLVKDEMLKNDIERFYVEISDVLQNMLSS